MRGKGKRGRHLARYVSIFLLSGGYTLPSLLPVYAAPVTGQNVTVDASHPAVTSSDPTNTPAGEPTHLAVAAGRYSFPALIPNAAHPTWPGYPPLLYAG